MNAANVFSRSSSSSFPPLPECSLLSSDDGDDEDGVGELEIVIGSNATLRRLVGWSVVASDAAVVAVVVAAGSKVVVEANPNSSSGSTYLLSSLPELSLECGSSMASGDFRLPSR